MRVTIVGAGRTGLTAAREWIRVLLEPETSFGLGVIPALDGIEEMRTHG